MYDHKMSLQKFTFAISSPDNFLLKINAGCRTVDVLVNYFIVVKFFILSAFVEVVVVAWQVILCCSPSWRNSWQSLLASSLLLCLAWALQLTP